MADITGRCYCGAVTFQASAAQTVVYCHCDDCKRATGAALPAFAAFAPEEISFTPDQGAGRVFASGVTRWNCDDCGSPLGAVFPYLPNQFYVPIGVIDQAATLEPELQCHANGVFPWLHRLKDTPKVGDTATDILQKAAK